MKQKKFQLVQGDNWEGLYVSGKLVCENHYLSHEEILEAIGADIDILAIDDDYLFEFDRLPEQFKDIPPEKLL